MRRFVAVVVALGAVAGASAQEVVTGTLEVAFGRVQGADGKFRDVKGLKLPYKAVKVKSRSFNRVEQYKEGLQQWMSGKPIKIGKNWGVGPMGDGGGGGQDAVNAIYEADQNTNGGPNIPYGVISDEFESCSVLDDITVVSGGQGKQWVNLTMGFDTPTDNPIFLIRWTNFLNFVAGRGPGVSAVDPYPIPSTYQNDFGVIWNQPVSAGTWRVTIYVAPASAFAPNQTFWFAQQFRQRTTPVNPDAPFKTEIRNVFNDQEPPQIGSSGVNYWLDNPADGIYSEDEADIFGEPQNPGQGNLLLKIDANTTGSIQEVFPTQVAQTIGTQVDGNFVSLWFDNDDDDFSSSMNWAGARTDPSAEVEITGVSPVAAVDAYGTNLRLGTSSGAGTARLQYYKYATPNPGWVTVKTVPVTAGFATDLNFWTAGTPSQFVNSSNRQIKMRIGIFPDPTVGRSFRFHVDKATWTIGRP